MDLNHKKNVALFVLWQSLVVRAYRSFFVHLCRQENLRIALAAPDKFQELGLQTITCEDFDGSFAVSHPRYPVFILKALRLHVQIVFFCGLQHALRTFFKRGLSLHSFCFESLKRASE